MPKRRASSRRQKRPAQALPKSVPRQQTAFERGLSTKRGGGLSELPFALAAARQGFGIARPYGDSERYDIILDPTHIDPAQPATPPCRRRKKISLPRQLLLCRQAKPKGGEEKPPKINPASAAEGAYAAKK